MLPNNEACRVWSRFERKRKDGSVLKLRIQDPPSSAQERVLDFIAKYFVTEETFQKAAGIYSNPDSIAEYREIIKEIFKKWIIVICCEDNNSEDVGDILGVSAVELVEDKSFDGLELQTKEIQNLITIMLECEK
ncbi:hypothetical protein RR46_14282 [Papilio xuthus]|uniref:Uncharacterized protein n=1 Tax=Papilio xuthus TaxID=66420 RepID=A0A194PI18_PAPXU|nr:hypothetical protein RR46_14282 [Papilio xuthus]